MDYKTMASCSSDFLREKWANVKWTLETHKDEPCENESCEMCGDIFAIMRPNGKMLCYTDYWKK